MQSILYTYGGEARVESHKILSMVSSDDDVLVIYSDKGSHEETGVSTVPSLKWTGSFQEALFNPS